MMYGGMVWGSLLGIIILLGFAYIVWVTANKEKGNIKTFGQVVAIAIVVFAVLILLYGTFFSGMMGRGWCGGDGMRFYRGPGMMR